MPSEAFEELNRPYSRGDHLHPVGPVVQEVSLPPARARPVSAPASPSGTGGASTGWPSRCSAAGVAADRGAQIQALCGLFERRSDTLHLVVVWPSATLEPGWFGWRNSRVVRTQHARGPRRGRRSRRHRRRLQFLPRGALQPDPGDLRAADRRRSWTTRHARARAACDRGLAAMVAPHELMKLERLIVRYLDDGEAEALRARLAAADAAGDRHGAGRAA